MPLAKEDIKQLDIGTPIVVRRVVYRSKLDTNRYPKRKPKLTDHGWWKCEWRSQNLNAPVPGHVRPQHAVFVGWKNGLNGWAWYEEGDGMVFEPEGPGAFMLRFRTGPGANEQLAFPQDCDIDFTPKESDA